jgi:transposase
MANRPISSHAALPKGHKGARASAIIYSIVESAKENGLNPYAYLNHLFEQLPNLDSRANEVLDQLLPWNVKL